MTEPPEKPDQIEKDKIMQDLSTKTEQLEQLIDQIIDLRKDQRRVQAEVIELQKRLAAMP